MRCLGLGMGEVRGEVVVRCDGPEQPGVRAGVANGDSPAASSLGGGGPCMVGHGIQGSGWAKGHLSSIFFRSFLSLWRPLSSNVPPFPPGKKVT